MAFSAEARSLVYETLISARENPARLLNEVLRDACGELGADVALIVADRGDVLEVAYASHERLVGEHPGIALKTAGLPSGLRWKIFPSGGAGSPWMLMLGGVELVQDVDLDAVHLIYALVEHVQSLELAMVDELTGLPARRATFNQLNTALAAARRNDDVPAILYLDLNNFKAVNDSYGHAKGDEVLRAVAKAMRAALREDEFIGRFGGDEFVVVLPRTVGRADAKNVAVRLSQAVSETVMTTAIPMSVSAGIAAYSPLIGSAQEWLNAADAALYEIKHAFHRRVG